MGTKNLISYFYLILKSKLTFIFKKVGKKISVKI